MSPRILSLRSIALAGAGTLLAASLGATLGVYVIAPPVPDSLSAPTTVTTATVSSRAFADERSVQMNVTVNPAAPVLAPRSGRVTALSLLPGGSIESGSKIMDIDGLPIVALHTSTPLYRDIIDGTAGADIKSLQEELARLGYEVSADGKVGFGTRKALAALLGVNNGSGGVPEEIPHTHILWIPQQKIVISEVKARLGDVLTDSSPILTYAGGLNVGVIQPPENTVPGDRVAIFENKEYPLASGTLVDNQELLAAVEQSPQRQNPSEGGQPSSEIVVSMGWKLAQPIDVQVVPASALFDVQGQQGCVSAQGKSIRVEIIGSELGQSFIQTPEKLTEVDLQVEGRTCQ